MAIYIVSRHIIPNRANGIMSGWNKFKFVFKEENIDNSIQTSPTHWWIKYGLSVKSSIQIFCLQEKNRSFSLPAVSCVERINYLINAYDCTTVRVVFRWIANQTKSKHSKSRSNMTKWRWKKQTQKGEQIVDVDDACWTSRCKSCQRYQRHTDWPFNRPKSRQDFRWCQGQRQH